jgi:hypothetical protein
MIIAGGVEVKGPRRCERTGEMTYHPVSRGCAGEAPAETGRGTLGMRMQQNPRESKRYAGASRSGYDGGGMADEGTLEDRFLGELYELAEGLATRVVSGEELARGLGMDPEGETDKARFLETARRLEEEGYVIANKTGPEVRDYSSLTLTHAGIRAVKEARRP